MVLNIPLVTKEVKLLNCFVLFYRGYIKNFKNGGKKISFLIKDDMCLDKYNKIWDKIKETLKIKFHSMRVYDEKYIKAKVREVNGVIKTNFLVDEIPKEGVHYACIACITIDSVMKKNELSTSLFRRMKIQNKGNKDDKVHKH